MTSTLHRSLTLTSMVCERGASLEQFKHIAFADGKVRAFNGLVHLEAESGLDPKEPHFAINFDRLSSALRALADDEFKVSLNKDFLIFKRGKFTVRIRRLPGESAQVFTPPPKKERIAGAGLKDALTAVASFVSSDASRPWSTAVLLRGGYAWATNNLALVRFPTPTPGPELRIPGPAISLLTELDSIDWYAKSGSVLYIGNKEATLMLPTSSADWPDVNAFFAARPKRIPVADPELLDAAKTVEKFADRFITLNDATLEGKAATIESEYEVEVKKGKGSYNARLFALVAMHATHIDFSTYPKPIHFTAGPMEGVMVGLAPTAVPAN